MNRIFIAFLAITLPIYDLPAQRAVDGDLAATLERNVAQIEKEQGMGAALVKPLVNLGWLQLTASRYPEATEALMRASGI